jgi:hypothetical protein
LLALIQIAKPEPHYFGQKSKWLPSTLSRPRYDS